MTITRLLPALFALALLATGCESGNTNSATDTSAALCGQCGQIKASADCCKKDVKPCAGCDLAKGSPGCCKMKKGEDTTLCTGCGQIKGSDQCCSKEAPKCEGCKLHKGSPGCCKLTQ